MYLYFYLLALIKTQKNHEFINSFPPIFEWETIVKYLLNDTEKTSNL